MQFQSDGGIQGMSLRQLCELCANVSLFLERIPFAQSSQRTAKLAKKLISLGMVFKEARATKVDPMIALRYE